MMTGEELRAFLYDLDIAPLGADLIADEAYSLPSPDAIRGEYSSALRALQFYCRAQAWAEQSNDCDDFTRLAAALAQLMQNRTRQGTALAVGEFWYRRDAGGGHALLLFIIREGSERKLFFYEPQSCSEVKLSPQEITSCTAYRF